ncbi:MAG: PAS domain-containing protein [Bifidobacteriaceae bacterium]|jgi:predicted transcriptional regulator YheO|nr:PAS domain-containing protein [Bifidobacteriaceae bacterium]
MSSSFSGVIDSLNSQIGRKTFESVKELSEVMLPVMQAVSAAVGPSCELVLHDLSVGDLSKTVFAIVNGQVTGRVAGGPSTNLGIELFRDEQRDHDEYGYEARTADGRELRSSSVYYRNSKGKIIAAFCVNVDLTPMQQAMFSLEQLLPPSDSKEKSDAREIIAPDISEVLDGMISEAFDSIGKPPAMMTKEDRTQIMRLLDERGVFQVKRAIDLVSQRMGISRVTAYTYLNESNVAGK